MKNFNEILKKSSLIKKIIEVSKTDLVLSLSGAGLAEKVLCAYALINKNEILKQKNNENYNIKQEIFKNNDNFDKQKVVFIAKDGLEFLEFKQTVKDSKIKYSEFLVDLNPPIYMQIKDYTNKYEVIDNLSKFLYGNVDLLIVNPESLLYKFHNKINNNNYIKIEKNNNYNLVELVQKLIKNGYKKCEKVEKSGEFSVKGDILDIFLTNYDYPVRMDFFGDELEKIYTFDSFEMQKIEDLESVDIFSNKHFSLNDEQKNELINNLKACLLNSNLTGDSLIKNHLLVNQIAEGLKENLISEDEEFLMPFYKEEYSLLDLVGNAKIIVSEPKKIFDDLTDVYKSVNASIYDYIQNGELLVEHSNYFFEPGRVLNFSPNLIFNLAEQKIFKVDVKDYVRTIGSRNYCFDYKSLTNDLFIYQRSNYKVVLFAGSKESKDSLSEFLLKYGLFTSDELVNNNKFQVVVLEDYFSKSFSFLDSGIIVIGTDDLIKKTKQQVKNISGNAKKHKVFYLPKVGDYVVHETHGIGKCISLEKLNLNGTEKDYFVLEYLGGDKLFLPSEQADLISAYMGGDAEPKLNKIGGEQFAKIKAKVKESVSKLAINLVEIYSQREKAKGFVYSEDNYLTNAFEESFEFEETADQISAISDIKKDMQSTKIMDRLICGDVGYGKTEVALRAIYKAISDGKQVAFLCPTTILSQQHYKTAKSRFKDFMVNVAVLNRFKTKEQQEQILKEVKDGKVDLLIGTHRLLSDDVVFKDLGLLVLDEEQRFGVKDKEKIKELKKDINVLTLSATPIPRTLNMALTGIRDISIIETPPKQRIPVKTFVVEESDALILDACKKEIGRGGQVLFVYNRVEHIYDQLERLKTLLPNARIGVAHGQMPRKLLEQTIMNLYNGEYDILIATTLIESGIDLPLANTLICIDSDRLGLSELYQLRGRIGRSDRIAYAYFTYNPSKALTNDAYKRLDAILEYTEFGSGFKIAMRDLEIRGAGNVLGKEQHGHLEKVGYDLYCKLLESAVKELKGEKVKESKPIKIDVSISANIPNAYVETEEERIKLYTDISLIATDGDYENVSKNLIDTYGKYPKEVENLLKIAYIKNLGIKNNVKRVFINSTNAKIYLYKAENIISEHMSKALSETKNGALAFEDSPLIKFDFTFASVEQKLEFVLNFLKSVKND